MIYQRKPTFSNSNNLLHKASTFHKTNRQVRHKIINKAVLFPFIQTNIRQQQVNSQQ